VTPANPSSTLATPATVIGLIEKQLVLRMVILLIA